MSGCPHTGIQKAHNEAAMGTAAEIQMDVLNLSFKLILCSRDFSEM